MRCCDKRAPETPGTAIACVHSTEPEAQATGTIQAACNRRRASQGQLRHESDYPPLSTHEMV